MANKNQPRRQMVPADKYQELVNQLKIHRLALENLGSQLQRSQGETAVFRTFLGALMLQEGIDKVELTQDTLNMLDRGVLKEIKWSPAEDQNNLILELVYSEQPAEPQEEADAADQG